MRRTSLSLALAALGGAVALGLLPTLAVASETGMASIHPWRKVGRKTCLVGHQHDGSGSGATRKQAERAAIASWAEFTALEYGTSWANFGAAIEKGMSCGGGGSWSCSLAATPCRPF